MRKFNGLWWPDSDVKLAQVFDWVSDIDEIIKHVKKFDVCVQAGGACGQWPAEFAKHFKHVVTFEPVKENFECLVKNIPSNVVAINSALFSSAGLCQMNLDDFEAGNAGAWYAGGFAAHDAIGANWPMAECCTIDGCDLVGCDLIQLDVEGGEFDALQGARKTIEKFRPVIVIEEKPLPHMTAPVTSARKLIESMGYHEAGRIHRDVIFVS